MLALRNSVSHRGGRTTVRAFERDARHARTPRRSRVVVLNWRDPWHPEGGGSELYVHQVAQRMIAAGVDVTWVTARYPGSAPDEVVDGIRFVRRGGHLTVYLWVAWLLFSRRLDRMVGGIDSVLEVQNGMP